MKNRNKTFGKKTFNNKNLNNDSLKNNENNNSLKNNEYNNSLVVQQYNANNDTINENNYNSNTNYYGGINEMTGNQNINILTGDYINEFNNTVHIRPHPHHFSIPEKSTKTYQSYSRTDSPVRSSSKTHSKSNSKNKKNSNNKSNRPSKNKKSTVDVDSDDNDNDKNDNNSEFFDYYDENDDSKSYKKKSTHKKNKNSVKIKNKNKNNSERKTVKINKLTEKDKIKNKIKGQGRGKKKENFSKRKENDQYELIGKTTLDICKLFFDEYEVEKSLDYPLGEIKHFGFKLSLSEPLLSIKQRKYLNPIAIEIISAKSMPPKPNTNNINYARIAPTYCKFSFIDQEKEYKCFEEHRYENNKIIFNSVHLLLSGHIKEEELFNTLLYKKLNIILLFS